MSAAKSGPQHRAADLAARDRTVMKRIADEQTERASKSARLRKLRLAKEAVEKENEEKVAAERLVAAQHAIKKSSSAKKAAGKKAKPTTKDNQT